MAVFAGPRIVEDGLVVHLDAANEKSYDGTSTWKDLVAERNMVLYGSPTFNTSGFLSFNGVNQYGLQTNEYNFSSSVDYCFEVWFKMRTLPTAQYGDNGHIWGGQNGNNLVLYLNPASNGKSKLNMIHDDSRYSGGGHFSNYQIEANEWVQWVAMGDASTDKIAHYINGELDKDFSAVISGQEVKSWGDARLAYDSRWSKYSELDVAVLKQYNRLLTAAEVKQNFEALRGRFGI